MGNMHDHEGIPSVKVVVDGGWSMRMHKHTYNAKSGVAVILGIIPRSCFLLEFEINIAQFVLCMPIRDRRYQNINATKIGVLLWPP